MDRYTATRFVMRVCVLALSIGPAHGQVQVGELIVTPGPDSVTVRLARAPGELPAQQARQVRLTPAEQEPAEQGIGVLPVQPDRPAPSAVRVFVADEDLPPLRPRWRPLPPMPAPRRHQMERDMLTLKAARAAMELDDQLHVRKMAALR